MTDNHQGRAWFRFAAVASGIGRVRPCCAPLTTTPPYPYPPARLSHTSPAPASSFPQSHQPAPPRQNPAASGGWFGRFGAGRRWGVGCLGLVGLWLRLGGLGRLGFGGRGWRSRGGGWGRRSILNSGQLSSEKYSGCVWVILLGKSPQVYPRVCVETRLIQVSSASQSRSTPNLRHGHRQVRQRSRSTSSA